MTRFPSRKMGKAEDVRSSLTRVSAPIAHTVNTKELHRSLNVYTSSESLARLSDNVRA